MQREAIAHVVALSDGVIVEEIVDLDESGGTMNRPGLKRVFTMLDLGQADGIVVARLDRFGRSLEVPLVIEDLVADGKVFLSAADQFDTGTPMGRFALGMMSLVAKLERDRHIETWGKSTRNAIQRGVAIRIPYGYQRAPSGRLEPCEPAASTVQEMFRLRAAGYGVAAIADNLNESGARPPHAAMWTRQTVRAMLKVRTYLGEARYGDNVTVGAHPALIEDWQWRAAQPSVGVSRPTRGKNLLTGLLRCAGCGYLMGAGTGRGGPRYSCNRAQGGGRCPSPTAAMAPRLEALVTEQFLDRYGAVDVTAAETNTELAALETALSEARREFEAWRDDISLRRVLGEEDYRAGLLARHAHLEATERDHAEAVRGAAAHSLVVDAAVWDDLSMPERRKLLAAGIDDIVLSRAENNKVPIADRCLIRWTGDGTPDAAPRQGARGFRI